MDCNRSGVTVYEKSGAPAVWTLAGILSWSTAPGMGFAVVASAGAGAGAAGAWVAGARVAGPVALTTGALRGGGATGVVAMTWISGSFVALELEASWAATVPGAIASAVESAQSDPWSGTRMTEALIRSAKPKSLPICSLQHERVFVYNEDACHFSHLNIRLLRSSKRRIPHVENDATFPHHCTRARGISKLQRRSAKLALAIQNATQDAATQLIPPCMCNCACMPRRRMSRQ